MQLSGRRWLLAAALKRRKPLALAGVCIFKAVKEVLNVKVDGIKLNQELSGFASR
jgi:hypothetical protein